MKQADRHHLLFFRREWSEREALPIRNDPSLIYKMDRQTHEELHRDIEAVPLLGRQALIAVGAQYRGGVNTFQNIDRLLSAIDQAGRFDKVKSELAVEAIEAQLPYIRDGMRKTK